MIHFRPLLVMTLISVAAFVVLLTFGRLQWDRYETKMAAADEPIAEMTIESYQPISGGLQFVFGVRPDTHEQGWRVFAPVQYGSSVVFVDADFIAGSAAPQADEVRVPASLRLGAPIAGATIRPESPAPLALSPRPLQRLWFAVDLPAMGRNAGLDAVADYYFAGSYVGADGRAGANPFARAPGADALPPARHLGYALTWYGLALVLLVIFFAYHASVGRLGFRTPRPAED